MPEGNETIKEQKTAPETETPVSPLENADTAFVREIIKARPVNRRLLFRRTLLTAVMAIVFGGIACLTFLLLEPFFSTRFSREEEPQIVTFPTSEDEIQPEDLYTDDEEIVTAQEQIVAEAVQASIEASEDDRIRAAVNAALERYRADSHSAGEIYRSLKGVVTDAEKSLVLVRAAKTQDAFVGGTVEQRGEAPGLIIADNNVEILILTYASILEKGSALSVTWCDGTASEATRKDSSPEAGLCVLAVPKRIIPKDTRPLIAPATLGSSVSSSFIGTPVIAVGSPVGIYHSFCYGLVASDKLPVDCTDRALRVYATDIYGGGECGGFLLGYNGLVLGIIYPDTPEGIEENRIVAYSISEAKPLIEHLVNAIPRAYLGIHGVDTVNGVSGSLGLPAGALVDHTDMGSPAMTAGLQSGDIITAIDQTTISSWEEMTTAMNDLLPETLVTLHILRQGPEDYIPMELEMTTEEGTK